MNEVDKLAIKMRVSKDLNAKCHECGNGKDKSLDMFDVMIGGDIICLCDLCVKAMFDRCLSAVCYTNGRVKQQKEIRLINDRAREAREARERKNGGRH